jgi:hypothetical protein
LTGDLAVRARNAAKRSSHELLCPRKLHPILSAKPWGLVRLTESCHRILVQTNEPVGCVRSPFGEFNGVPRKASTTDKRGSVCAPTPCAIAKLRISDRPTRVLESEWSLHSAICSMCLLPGPTRPHQAAVIRRKSPYSLNVMKSQLLGFKSLMDNCGQPLKVFPFLSSTS